MLTESHIREALRACYTSSNPYQRPLDIVDLGLIESLTLTPDPEAPGAHIPGVPPKFRLTLTLIASSPDDEAQAVLHAQIANRLAGLPELSRTNILLIPTPTWTPARLTLALQRELHPHFPILNNRR